MNALVVVAKQPVPGQTKTRLCPALTFEAAARLYEAFLRDTLELVRRVPNVRPVLAYLPETAQAYFRALAPDFDLLPQRGADLGARLDNAVIHCLGNSCQSAVVMDSDSPTLPVDYLCQAFTALAHADGVLGPCDDGGYYLIGLKRPAPQLLREVRMSTPEVVQDTLALAAAANLRFECLPAWFDVDTPAELGRLCAELITLPPERGTHTRAAIANCSPLARSNLQSPVSPLPSPLPTTR